MNDTTILKINALYARDPLALLDHRALTGAPALPLPHARHLRDILARAEHRIYQDVCDERAKRRAAVNRPW